ncbi:MAG TPA: hypothetical protein VHU84_07315 [Lacipirellulaceae bacterium]|nr:hypothetical protein [Lacipirellulaceae bacterium]
MSTDAHNLLNAFDSLAPAEQQLVAAEILRRSVSSAELASETFDQLAREIFQQYDAEESGGAES